MCQSHWLEIFPPDHGRLCRCNLAFINSVFFYTSDKRAIWNRPRQVVKRNSVFYRYDIARVRIAEMSRNFFFFPFRFSVLRNTHTVFTVSASIKYSSRGGALWPINLSQRTVDASEVSLLFINCTRSFIFIFST